MKPTTFLSRSRVFGFLILSALGAALAAHAQPLPAPAVEATGSTESNQAELLKSLVQVREQLQATQLAIANNQLAAETKSRAQAIVIAQQLEALKSAMTTDRDSQQVELQRARTERERLEIQMKETDAERVRLQIQSERSNRRLLYVASSFGCVGLIAMILLPVFQWRAVNRIAEADAQRALIPVGGLLPEDGGTHRIALANERLTTALDRIERHILELENTVSHPPADATPERSLGLARNVVAQTDRAIGAASDRNPRIAAALAKGRSLLSLNKPAEALACYEEILRLDPRHVGALLKKGLALERMGRDADALIAYDQAIAADPKTALAYLHKGGVCQRLARHEEAVACYELAMEVEEAAK